MQSRLGVALFGSTGSGKTTVWRLLQEALRLQQKAKKKFVGLQTAADSRRKEEGGSGHSIKVQLINPKSLQRDHLLGYVDERSREWIDGLLPILLRKLLF